MLALDYETCCFGPGYQAPHIVCTSLADDGGPLLYPTEDTEAAARIALQEGLCGVNIAYDMACLLKHYPHLADLIWDAYENGRIIDLICFERAAEISGCTNKKFKYSLETLGMFYGVSTPDKDDGVRLSYGTLWGLPLSAYSSKQTTYALADGESTWRVHKRQLSRYAGTVHMSDVAMLSRDMFWLQLTRNRGFETDPKKTYMLRQAAEVRLGELREFATEVRLLPGEVLGSKPNDYRLVRPPSGKKGYVKNVNRIRQWVKHAYDNRPPMTVEAKNRTSKEKFVPNISTARATLEESGDLVLETFATYGEWSSVMNKDVPMLENSPVHTRYGLADTTRTTSSKPNTQNFKRSQFKLADGSSVGIRECVVPRPGYCFVGADWSMLELCTLAQHVWTTLGKRDLLDKINSGVDCHSEIASEMLGMPYQRVLELKDVDEEVGNYRNLGKVYNFGVPGGMGKPETLQLYAKQNYGLRPSLDVIRKLLLSGAKRNPDIQAHLNWVRSLPRFGRGYCVGIPGSTLTRRGATYCAAANTPFQSLGGRVSGVTGWAIQRACHGGSLAGCYPVLFIHDEFILEVPIGEQTRAAKELVRLMVETPAHLVPDVKLKAEPFCSAVWSKKAKAEYDDSGQLKIWQPS